MRLMSVIERSGDKALLSTLKKLTVVFGWLADLDNCSNGKIAWVVYTYLIIS